MAERHRQEETPQAPVALDDRGHALELLLPEVLAEFQPEVGAVVDLVVAIVKPQDVPAICKLAKEDPRLSFDYLMCLCVVDYVEHLQVVYHLYSTTMKHMMVLKANVSPEKPSLPSVTSMWAGADWYERESHDLFGVAFEGHPNMAPLLLYEGFEGYPGRRDYEMPEYREW
ncbi:MAG: NADH-quinone oxidoreductase subunit C [Dehalococcoidia bacterium]|nr:NADH-quinone oxidoreductase subunit C [Dehalococcoidia bacterium]